MYYSKIEAAIPVDTLAVDGAATKATRGETALGLALLVVGLPLLAIRVFAWAVARDVRKLVRAGGVIGGAVVEARRTR